MPMFITFFGFFTSSMLSISHSMAPSRLLPSSLMEQTGYTAQFLFILFRSNLFDMYSTLIVATSLLLANTSTTQSCISGWSMIFLSYLAAKSILSWSELSTTYIRPLHLSKQCDHRFRSFSWPPTSQTRKLMVLQFSYYTLNPIVGIVLIVQFSFRAYSVVVFPAPSRPSIRIFDFLLGSFLSNRPFMKLPIQISEFVYNAACFIRRPDSEQYQNSIKAEKEYLQCLASSICSSTSPSRCAGYSSKCFYLPTQCLGSTIPQLEASLIPPHLWCRREWSSVSNTKIFSSFSIR